MLRMMIGPEVLLRIKRDEGPLLSGILFPLVSGLFKFSVKGTVALSCESLVEGV